MVVGEGVDCELGETLPDILGLEDEATFLLGTLLAAALAAAVDRLDARSGSLLLLEFKINIGGGVG